QVKVAYAAGTLGTRPLPKLNADTLTPTEGTGHGLTAAFYASPDFSGAPAATRLEETAGGSWTSGPPAPGLGRTWSARWTGTLTPAATGAYRFSLEGSGIARLEIDRREVARLDSQFGAVAHGLVDLTAGKAVPIRVEYVVGAIFRPGLDVGWQP